MFRILPVPARGDETTLSSYDPMLANSITNQQLRQDVRQALESRGDRPADGERADFDVVDPSTRQLLWRGQGVAQVSDNPNKYANELGQSRNQDRAETSRSALIMRRACPGLFRPG